MGLPALSPSVEESKIVAWKKKEGDLVEVDEAIASVQTDKAELDWQVTDDVYLAKILLEPGKQVPVGTPACIFVDSADDCAAFKNYDPSKSADSAPPSKQESAPKPQETKPASSAPSKSNESYPEHRVEGMPALSPTAVDGAVVEWLVKEGDAVEEGSGIAEIQTDKSVVTWSSTDDAYIAKLLVKADAENRVPVGTPMIILVDEKKDIDAFKDYEVSAAADPSSSEPAPAQSESKKETKEAAPQPTKETAKSSTTAASKSGRVAASPYAKKLAAEMGVNLDDVTANSGERIVAADVMKASQQKPASKSDKVSAPKPTTVISSDRSFEDIPVSMMREIIGKRLSESKFTAPHFYVTMECAMDTLMKMREDINDDREVKISVNDFIIKACAAALRDVPDCNVGWIQKGSDKPVMRKYNYVDISVAVATPTGLLTPIIKDVDQKSLADISAEMKDLAKRAKVNKLAPDEFQGGTFTISNMGMFGVSNFTAIINPPQSCILAVGGAKQKLVPDASNAKGFKVVTVMEVTLSSDHRSVDGALAAVWVNAFQKYIEKPAKLLL